MKKQKRLAASKPSLMSWRHWAIIVLLIAVLLGYGLMVSWLDGQWLRRTQIGTADRTPGGTITIKGEVVCLPHRDQTGPQTEECALGVKDRGGYYYAVRETKSSLTTGERAEITGRPIPASSNEKYDIIGTVIPQ